MNQTVQDRPGGVVCRCSGTTAQQIRRLVEKGICDLDGISRATGACSGCGACDYDLSALLLAYASAASTTPPAE